MDLPWRATSRGLALERAFGNIGSMSPLAIRALEQLGVCIGDDCTRLPAAVTLADFERAHRIVALKWAEHWPLLRERFPTWSEKVEFWHVEDAPEALDVIEHQVRQLAVCLKEPRTK